MGANNTLLLDLRTRRWCGKIVKAGPPGIAAIVPTRNGFGGLERSAVATCLRLSGFGTETPQVAASHDKTIIAKRRTEFFGIFVANRGGWWRRGEVVELCEDGDGGRGVLRIFDDMGSG